MTGFLWPSDDTTATGWRPNGWICGSNDQCQSGHCCSLPFQWDRCSECCSDLNCSSLITEPPLPGSYGAPFCLDDSRTCSPYKNGESSQIPDSSGYPIWVPIQDETDLAQVDIPRTVVEGEEPVMEQVWYFDLKEQPVPDVASQVEYNGTHVLLPLHTQMISGYSRTYKMYNEHETGIITSVFVPNAVSVVAGAAEKIHAITYESEYITARGEYIRQRNKAALQAEPEFDLGNFAGRMDALSVIWGALAIGSFVADSTLQCRSGRPTYTRP